jgi:hypothetical protein
LKAVVGHNGPQVVRVPADDPQASLRVVFALDTAVNVQHRERLCIGQCRRFDRLDGALAYLGSFWESMGETSGEESFAYGWGIGHPEHSVADLVQEAVTEELFWVRGVLPHTFYADQHAAADLLESLLTTDRIDYEDRYMLASVLATVDHDSTPKIPRYWNVREERDYRFEWDESLRARLRETIEDEGFHERLPENWTFGDMDV